MKRIIDFSFSLWGAVVFLPVFLIVALAIKLEDGGKVFFKQKRLGKNFKPFMLYKFRSMATEMKDNNLFITVGGDQRVTKIGRILRKFKIDELPQLINVLRGDMSLVGPRPEVEIYINFYLKDYTEILRVKPGITDPASVIYRNEAELLRGKANPEAYYINILMPSKIESYKKYLRERNFFLDLSIVFKTLGRIFIS